MNHIPMGQMRSGHLYKIIARNARYGIWISEENGFIISRHKWSENYSFIEYHWDTGAPHGTAKPLEDLGRSPFDYLKLVEIAKGRRTDINIKVLEFLNHQGGEDDQDNSV